MTEHTVALNKTDKDKLLEWLREGSGALTLGRVTFESVVGGGIFVRTQPWSSSHLARRPTAH